MYNMQKQISWQESMNVVVNHVHFWSYGILDTNDYDLSPINVADQIPDAMCENLR